MHLKLFGQNKFRHSGKLQSVLGNFLQYIPSPEAKALVITGLCTSVVEYRKLPSKSTGCCALITKLGATVDRDAGRGLEDVTGVKACLLEEVSVS